MTPRPVATVVLSWPEVLGVDLSLRGHEAHSPIAGNGDAILRAENLEGTLEATER